jgi:hypothetical protein
MAFRSFAPSVFRKESKPRFSCGAPGSTSWIHRAGSLALRDHEKSAGEKSAGEKSAGNQSVQAHGVLERN